MSGFTKGPWMLLHSIPEEGVECFWLRAQPGGGICRGFSQEIASINGPQCGEQLANARLIAAAPELYEECRALYAVMFHQKCPKCGIAWSEDECQEMGARRKAICLCGYEQAIDGTALSKAAGEGVL